MQKNLDAFIDRFGNNLDHLSVRHVQRKESCLAYRRGHLQPIEDSLDEGAMVTVIHNGGLGHAATTDLSLSGLELAMDQAASSAEKYNAHMICDFTHAPAIRQKGAYRTHVQTAWDDVPLTEKLEILKEISSSLGADPRIVHHEASFWNIQESVSIRSNRGSQIDQTFAIFMPQAMVTASEGDINVTRSLGHHDCTQQGGMELMESQAFLRRTHEIVEEALEMLSAPVCPTDKMDLLLMPDQMILQVHESIGHPLELDRILGDERNYAGSSFVRQEDFGKLTYGSKLLNVSFDPWMEGELASYAFDDEGSPAQKAYLIEKGLLKRSLGGAFSQSRASVQGMATSRACSWNRPPIDRIPNLNVEPGESSLETMIESVERGILMRTNRSWSIDDMRNKFQFGCEVGQMIENGKLTHLVRNPGYRSQTTPFWNSLIAVGDQSTFEVQGSPFCGKGEPNQCVRVGHATPACLFSNIDVFGAGQ